jgi:hypothetical protein
MHVRASSVSGAATAAPRDYDGSFQTWYESAATYTDGVYTGSALTPVTGLALVDTAPAVSLVPTMTAASTTTSLGTFTTSASSFGLAPYSAFDANLSTFFESGTQYSSGGYVGTRSTLVAGVGAVGGEWIQINFPSPVVIRQYGIIPRAFYASRAPGTFVVAGSSDDGATWTVLDQQVVTKSVYSDNPQTETVFTVITPPPAYTTIRLITTVLAAPTGGTGSIVVDIAEWKLYGTRDVVLGEYLEVRLPRAASLSTYTLSPRPGFSASAPSSLVLAASPDHGRSWVSLHTQTVLQSAYTDYTRTSFDVSTTTAYDTYRLIARSLYGGATALALADWTLLGLESTAGPTTVSPTSATASSTSLGSPAAVSDGSILTGWTSAATYSGAYTGAVSTTLTGLGPVAGDYLQLTLSAPAVITRYDLAPSRGLPTQAPLEWVLAGSLDLSTWTVIDQQTVPAADWVLADTGAHSLYFGLATNTVAYASYRLVCRSVGSGATACSLSTFELLSQTATHTTDMPLIPPLASASHGNGFGGIGGYTASASSIPTTQSPHAIFAHPPSAIAVTDDALTSKYTDGVYTGAVTSNNVAGEYIQLSLPVPAYVTRLGLAPSFSLHNAPSAFTLLASNDDGASWTTLLTVTGISQDGWTLDVERSFDVVSPDACTLYRLVCTTLYTGGVYPTLSVMQLYGRALETLTTQASGMGVVPQRLTGLAGLSSSSSATGLVISAPPGSSVVDLLGSTSPTLLQKMAAGFSTGTLRSARSTVISGLAAPSRKLRARMQDLQTQSPGTPLATWGSFTQTTPANQPVYALGTDGLPEVQFDRTLGHFMDGGTRSFALADNQGFTIVLHLKPTGTAISNEVFFDVGPPTGGWTWGIRLIRYANYDRFSFTAGDGSTLIASISNIGPFPQNTWTVVAARYLRVGGNGYVQVYVNNVKVAEQNIGASAFVNRTNARTYIGKHTQTSATGLEFNGSMRFAGMWDRALSDTELTSLYASLVGSSRNVVRTPSKLLSRPALALQSSLTATSRQSLLNGRLAKGFASLYSLVTDLAALAPSTTAVPSQSPATLKLNSLDLGVPCDYAVLRGSQTVTSTSSLAPFFTSVKDTRPAVVVVDGSLTIEAGATFIPGVRKLFTVLYVSGNLVVNGSISMTARGANHSGTGDSGGHVPPHDIRIYTGTWDAVTNPQIPAFGGAGGVATASNPGNPGAAPGNGATGGGGAGGFGTGGVHTGHGAAGTSFTGGTGGGGTNGVTLQGGPGGAFGGAGGRNMGTYFLYGRGGGNPDNGTGGTLIVVVGGVLSGSGAIESNGSAGVGNGAGGAGTIGGGGSGGGSVSVLAQTGGDLVGITATGGGRVTTRSGLGGDGTARLLRTLAGPVISARVRDLSSVANGAVVATWGAWTSISPTQPTYALGTDSKYEVAFDRSLGQFMDSGTRTFNIGTNEGFTMAVHFKFTGTALVSEVILEVGDNFATRLGLLRYGNTTGLRVLAGDGVGGLISFNGGSVAQDTWCVAVMRYLRIDNVGYAQLFINNIKVVERNLGATALANRTHAKTYLGQAVGGTGYEFNGSIRFAAMWDRALSDTELSSLYTSLTA